MQNKFEFTFEKASLKWLPLVKIWWKDKPHIQEFWDNSPEMWANCENYFHGKKDEFDYWVGSLNHEPFALILTNDTKEGGYEPGIHYAEKDGRTIGIDFMIGEERFLNKGLSHLTLIEFMKFLKIQDPSVTAFLIDPEAENSKAVHVYSKAGFDIVGTFIPKEGHTRIVEHYMMKKLV